MGSALLSTPIIAPTNLDRHQILRNFCHESVRKGLSWLGVTAKFYPRRAMTDLVLKGGRVIDPASGRDETADIAFADGKVTEIGRDRLTAILATPTRTQHRALDLLGLTPIA